jgi:hypothetical protein
MRVLFAFCVATATLVQPSLAEVIDLSTITCRQFFEGPNNERKTLIMIWMLSNFRDKNAPYVLDTVKMTDNMKRIAVYCASTPDADIMTAATKMLTR